MPAALAGPDEGARRADRCRRWRAADWVGATWTVVPPAASLHCMFTGRLFTRQTQQFPAAAASTRME
jgi:hypothetical protein